MGSSNQSKHQPIRRRSVFVSSTSRDLIPHRQQVSDTLLRLGLFPVAMEQFGAQGSGDATSVSTDKVGEAEVYVGIFAWRYGYVPLGETRSVTHLEYVEARRLGMPCYLFLAHPDTEQDETLFPASLRDLEHRAQLLAFRDELQQAVVDYFSTPDDLARKIAAPLHDYLLKQERTELLKGPRPPRDLPPRTVGFVGREQEVRDLCATLRQGQSVALAAAVSGMGGVGKSALAAELVHVLAAESNAFPGGFAFVRCDERRALSGLVWVYDQLLSAWNILLSPEESANATTPEAEAELRERVLRARLRLGGNESRPPALVLLDNVERDLPVHRCLEILAALHITVLLTTRAEVFSARLRLVPLDVLNPGAAVALFQERYTSRGGSWVATRDAGPAAASVEALGYLPLAIELAAARAARTRAGVAALAAEMQAPDVLLRLQDTLDKTASIRYAFEKSLVLLTSTQRLRFAALGLPAGPDWPRPVVEQLLGALPPDKMGAAGPAEDVDILAALSLMTILPAEMSIPRPGQPPLLLPPRVRLHPLLRELAREEWARQPTDIQQAALEALLVGVSTLVEEHQQHFAFLEREEDLIVETLRQAGQIQPAPQKLSQVIATLTGYFEVGGHWRLGMELFPLELTARRELGDRAGEGKTFNSLGNLACGLGRNEEAARFYEQALVVAREVGDQVMEGATLNNLGELARHEGQTEEAARFYEQALVLAREVGDRVTEGAALLNLGILAGYLGRREEAHYYEQALALFQEVGNRNGEGTILNNLGSLAHHLGRDEEAARFYEQALVVAREVGDRAGEGVTLSNLGSLAGHLGRIEEARKCHEQALAIRREIGDRRGEGSSLHNLGILADEMGLPEEAVRYYEQALVIAREAGDRREEGRTLNNLGALASDLGKKEEAKRYYEQALAIRREVGDRAGEGSSLHNLGDLASDLGMKEEAAQYYEQALLIRREVGDRRGEGRTLYNLGSLAYGAGRKAEAAQWVRQALVIFEELGMEDDAHAARRNLAANEAKQHWWQRKR